jgi:hypothetical protein
VRQISLAICIVLLCVLVTFSAAQEEKKSWSVLDQNVPHKSISFTTDEGTWMNLDVSPDGKEIVFDLLGDIYILPISGGESQGYPLGSFI